MSAFRCSGIVAVLRSLVQFVWLNFADARRLRGLPYRFVSPGNDPDVLPMKLVLFANTEWYLYNFRRSLALALKAAGHDLLLISPPGPYGEKLRALGLRWQPLPMDRRSLNPLREAALLVHLWRLFRRERPDIVHCFTIKCAVYGSLAARAARVPVRVSAVAGMGYVFTSHDAKARLLRPLVRALLRWALGGRGARLILQNPDDMALFADAGLVDPDRVDLIMGSGVDCARYLARRGPREAGPLRVLLAARLLWTRVSRSTSPLRGSCAAMDGRSAS